jgi:diguanylate cyclase (GGDEF)-like protein
MSADDRTMTAAMERAVRLASVAPHLRKTFELLPQPIRVDAVLEDDPDRLPLAAKQLLKLGLLGCRVRIGSIRAGSEAPRVELSVGERKVTLAQAELGRELRTLFTTVLGALFDGSDAAHVLESLAFQSSSLSTLRRLTSHMLAATDIDRALYLMLAGITSGYGLGFNRAALFLHRPDTGGFIGAKAIGPHDEAEAHRVWEAIELEDLTIETMIDNYANGRFDTRLQQRVQQTELLPTAAPEDEVALALFEPSNVLFERKSPTNPGLAAFGTGKQFVLAAIQPHDGLRGLLFADNLYSDSPIRPELLEHVQLYVDQTALVWENLSLLERVAELAMTDGLTGLLNRREFDARFERERSRSERAGTPLSLVVFDVDHFKAVNDKGGHEQGDALLRTLGEVLRASTRGHDVVARYGGDELVALLPDCGPDQAAAAAARIGKLALDKGISLSIGAATWPLDCKDHVALFRAADEQLYRAKAEGRQQAFVGGQRISY